MNLIQIANKTIPAPENKTVLTKAEGNTQDIVAEVLQHYARYRNSLKKFAPYLKGRTVHETCSNIWNFWKKNIRYQVDPDGMQLIKSPAAVWATKFCDCKSFSVAVASCLHCLGIDGKFRFTSYGSNYTQPTHVYVVAVVNGHEIIIDCVWTEFGSEKPYAKNWDYHMTKIYAVSGLGEVGAHRMPPRRHKVKESFAVGELNIDVNDPTVSENRLELALIKQRLELEKLIHQKKSGIRGTDSVLENAYDVEIAGVAAAMNQLEEMENPGIAGKKRKAKRLAKAMRANDGKGVSKRQARLLRKAGVEVKKRKEGFLKRVWKGIKKVVTAPVRLAAKTQLPKNAPFFLYLYITDEKLLAKLPEAVATKRAKAQKYKSILVDKLQMKESNFDRIVRNGIMANMGNSPENVIADWMKQANFKIGLLPILAAAGSGLKLLLGKFGQNIQEDVQQFSPTPEDWGAINPDQRQELAQQYQQAAGNGMTMTAEAGGGGGYTSRESGGTWNENDLGTGSDGGDTAGKGVAPGTDESDLPGGNTQESGGNGMMILGLAALGFVAFSGGGGRKKSK